MKKINLDRTIQMLANVGVIGGIVFLGVEVHQNNEALGIQARLDRENGERMGSQRQIGNQAYVQALAKFRRKEELTDEDLIVLDMENEAKVTDMRLTYRLIQDGLLEEGTTAAAFRIVFHTKDQGLAEYWSRNRRPTDFQEWMEENVVNVSVRER